MTILTSDLWAPAGLVVIAGDLRLTPVSDSDLEPLVALVLEGIHPDDQMPFSFPWTAAPRDELPRRFAQYHWGLRSTFQPGDFHLDLAVRRGNDLVGVQGFGGQSYPVLRTVETGSWLGQKHQGRGIGTRMRQAVCALLFDHLGAVRITSGAFVDNPASRSVSRKVGYRSNGQDHVERLGKAAELEKLVLEPLNLVRGEQVDVAGVQPLRHFLGVDGLRESAADLGGEGPAR